MTDDLVKRLRQNDCFYKSDCTVREQAADRIEQLEVALREIAENNSVRAGPDKDMYRRWRKVATDAIDVALAALEGNKDD